MRSDNVLYNDAIGRMLERVDATAEAVGESFPLSADPATGVWLTSPDGRWTGGFWVGLLWLARQASGLARYREAAEGAMRRLEGRLRLDNVLNGLVFYYGAALGALLDSSAAGADLGQRGARALALTFRPAMGIIPLGHDSGSLTADAGAETNIDGVPGMSLLLWAASEFGDTSLGEMGAEHVRRHIELCMRPDGSLYQAALVDPESGALVRQYTPRGYAEGSTWARAQSWGLLGFVQAYAWTRNPLFMDAAMRAADWWLDAVPPSLVAFWDFDDPAIPATERDTSATAMTAAALLKIGQLAPLPAQRARYSDAGAATACALVEGYLTPTHAGDNRSRGILTEGCWQRNQQMSARHELIWGDYFLLEALLMLTGRLTRVI